MPRKSLKVLHQTSAATPDASTDSPSDAWYAGGLKFTCTQCGNCCTGGPGYVWLSEEEIVRLAEHLKLSIEKTVRQYCRRVNGHWSLKERKNDRGEYPCIFLDEQIDPAGRRAPVRKCTIYGVRPLQCRTWPFWDGLLASEQAWTSAHDRCPGMGQGKRHFTFEQIEALRSAEDWPEKTQTPTSK